MKFLYIEDSEADFQLFKKNLLSIQDFSADLLWAKNLKEGLEIIQQEQIDLCFVDLGLPDTVGIESVKAVRNFKPEVTLIVITSNEDKTTALSALRSGAHDYLPKSDLRAKDLERSIRYSIEGVV